MQPQLNSSFDQTGLVGDQPWLYHWIIEREKARIGRESGGPKPWTTDPIVQGNRFCNIRREDDKVTKWIKLNWRDRYDGHPNMVTAMVIARVLNRESSLLGVGFPDEPDFDRYLTRAKQWLKIQREGGHKIWTGAYLVSTNGHSMDKVDYIFDRVVKPVHKAVVFQKSAPWQSLQAFHTTLTSFDGMGSFMAGQVVADLKYTSVLRDAEDWMSWAPIGPGSKRGLNRYFGRPLESSIKTEQVARELSSVQYNIRQRLGIELPVHDVQNVMCETDKFIRIMKGEGTSRSRYPGK